MDESLPEPRHIHHVAFDLMLQAARDGALPIEELELAASEGNRLASEILVALEMLHATTAP
jgi:hypothetical protein